MAKKNIKPNVRFSGFTEDWKEQELREILTERKELQKISEDAPILAFAAGQGVIDRSERKSNNRDHLTIDQANKVYKLTEYNDIVYNPSNLKYGAIDRNKYGKGVISPIYVTFTTEEEPSFIELIVKSKKFKLRALQYEEGTVVKRQSVKPENLLSLNVKISPSFDEQKKIGNFFKYIDNLTSQHQQKYDKITSIKKIMLEKMFPKRGENIPEIRFKEFSDVWKQCSLGEMAESFEYGLNAPAVEYDGVNKYIRITDINDKTNKFNSDSLTSPGTDLSLADNYKLQEGDLLFARTGASVGKTYRYNNADGLVYYAGFLIRARLKPEFDSEFAFQNTLTNTYNNFIRITSQRSGQPGVNAREYGDYKIMLPKLSEQKKIGEYFIKVDNLISLHINELKKLNNIKKACFEKMVI